VRAAKKRLLPTDSGGRAAKIADMGKAGGIIALGQIASTTESESDSGFEKNVVLSGQKVHENWTTSDKQSELTALVGDRFMVEVKRQRGRYGRRSKKLTWQPTSQEYRT